MTILITGASSGFGLETAKLFTQNGWKVIACVRKTSDCSDLKKVSDTIRIVEMDVSDDRSVVHAFGKISRLTDTIDVLMNNAGFGYIGAIEDFTIDEVKEQFETNFFGAIRVIHNVAPIMRKQKNGLIINVSSINGRVSFPLYGMYSASKFALETVSEALAFELRPFGIRVVVVEPGTFQTNFVNNKKHPKQSLSGRSVYKRVFDTFHRRLERAKKSKLIFAMNPEIVARKIWSISDTKHPKLRYLVGFDAHLYYFLDRIVPKPVKFWALSRVYGWP